MEGTETVNMEVCTPHIFPSVVKKNENIIRESILFILVQV